MYHIHSIATSFSYRVYSIHGKPCCNVSPTLKDFNNPRYLLIISVYFFSSVGCADNEALTKLLHTLFLVALPCSPGSFRIFFSDRSSLTLSVQIRHIRVSWSLPGGDQSSTGRVRRPVGLKRPLSPKGTLPTPAVCVSQLFRVPGEPFHLA